MKKKLAILLANLCLLSYAVAQTQQGYVKTKGRMVSGKYYEGKRIPGATLKIKNRSSVLCENDGGFSFPVSGKCFSLEKVEKKGYVLIDHDVLYRQYMYSSNPFVLVMEDKAQLEADRRAIERQVRRVTDEELQRRGEEIETLKEQHKITEERYHELLQKLNNDYDQNEQLIKDMVEQYNKIDFDQMDDFNRRVSDYIINGRLDEADSLLHTKGNIDEQIDNLNKHHKANAEARNSLEKSEAVEEYNRKNIAQFCYNKFLIFRMRHMYDSAAYYIEKRALLNPPFFDWLHETAAFYDEYLGNYDKSLQYYQKALAAAEQSGDPIDIARANDNIGSLMAYYDNGAEGLIYTKKAQAIRKKALGDFHHDVAVGYSNIGFNYDVEERYDSALAYFEMAIELLKKNDDTNNIDYAQIYHNYANATYNSGDINNALNLFERTLYLKSSILLDTSAEMANFYNDYGMILNEVGSFNDALQLHRKALYLREKNYGEKNLATTASYTNIGFTYSSLGKYDSALFYYNKALFIDTSICGINNSIVARGYNNIGVAYSNLNDYPSSLKNHRIALDIRKKVLGENHSHTATSYNNIGFVFWRIGMLDSALVYHQKALSVRIATLGSKHPDVAMSYSNIGAVYLYLNKYQEALLNIEKTLDIYKDVYGENSLDVAGSYNGLAQTYEKMGDLKKAEEYFKKSIDIMEEFFPDNHPTLINVKERLACIREKK